MPKTTPHQITADEREAIIAAARDEANSDKAHRKLAHHLSRTTGAFVSESTVLRVLRSVALVCRARCGDPIPDGGEHPEGWPTVEEEPW